MSMNKLADIIVIVIIVILSTLAIIKIRKSKGKCSYCGLKDKCPIRNIGFKDEENK